MDTTTRKHDVVESDQQLFGLGIRAHALAECIPECVGRGLRLSSHFWALKYRADTVELWAASHDLHEIL